MVYSIAHGYEQVFGERRCVTSAKKCAIEINRKKILVKVLVVLKVSSQKHEMAVNAKEGANKSEDKSQVAMPAKNQAEKCIKLKRVVSKWEASAYIICIIIGSGIFVSPKKVLDLGGSPGGALIIWAFTGKKTFSYKYK